MKFINEQIQATNENTKNLRLDSLHFNLKQILNKRFIFGTTIIEEELIIDRIIHAIDDPYNDKYWIEHKQEQTILH